MALTTKTAAAICELTPKMGATMKIKIIQQIFDRAAVAEGRADVIEAGTVDEFPEEEAWELIHMGLAEKYEASQKKTSKPVKKSAVKTKAATADLDLSER